jgi:hypothetical protein
MVTEAVELVGRDLGGVEALIELLAEGGRQASEFTFSYHPGRSIPFKAGDVKGVFEGIRIRNGKNGRDGGTGAG